MFHLSFLSFSVYKRCGNIAIGRRVHNFKSGQAVVLGCLLTSGLPQSYTYTLTLTFVINFSCIFFFTANSSLALSSLVTTGRRTVITRVVLEKF